MKSSLVEYYLFLVLVRLTKGNITALCGTADSYWEVREGEQDNTFTCTGLSAQDTVAWVLRESGAASGDVYLGSCPPRLSDGSEPVCETKLPPFKPRRISDDKGITVANTTASSFTGWFERGRLVCSVQGSAVAADGCRLDYIYEDNNISCTVQFKNSSWTVFGQCDVKKSRSSQKRYRCEWMQTKESAKEVIMIANTSMLVVPLDGKYVNGTCNFSSYLPSDGRYTYSVTIVPGQVTINASFVESNEIRRSTSTPYHNCPRYVQEGGAINCKCFISDLGNPPGKLQWNTTLSSELRLFNVQSFDFKTYLCQLFWNSTAVQSVEYVLKKGYSPSVLTFSINNQDSKTVSVDEKSLVEMRCYSDGKHKPSSRLINAAEPSQFLNQSEPADDTVDYELSGEVSLIIHQVPCQASGVYRCDVNNSIGQDSQSRTLLVSCAPKRVNNDGDSPIANVTNGLGLLTFKMMAYPTPEMINVTCLGKNDSSYGHPVKKNSIYAACSTTLLAPASVICNIIVINMTHNDEGFYRIVFSNSLGDLPFTFIVKVSENDQQAGAITITDEKIAGVVVLAVVLSIVVVLILLVFIWVWRRGWTLPCSGGTNQSNIQQNHRSGDTSEQSLTPGNIKTLSTTEGRATPFYDALQMNDVGKQSHYEEILRQHNVSEISTYEDMSSRMRQTRNEPTYVN